MARPAADDEADLALERAAGADEAGGVGDALDVAGVGGGEADEDVVLEGGGVVVDVGHEDLLGGGATGRAAGRDGLPGSSGPGSPHARPPLRDGSARQLLRTKLFTWPALSLVIRVQSRACFSSGTPVCTGLDHAVELGDRLVGALDDGLQDRGDHLAVLDRVDRVLVAVEAEHLDLVELALLLERVDRAQGHLVVAGDDALDVGVLAQQRLHLLLALSGGPSWRSPCRPSSGRGTAR